mmetsp:Transcript_89005/g.144208  ORF Transcript_89005/g.144208 Transcript_89005/m.144208 type:complete len:264 (-) Transcript_89005:21-812(-)
MLPCQLCVGRLLKRRKYIALFTAIETWREHMHRIRVCRKRGANRLKSVLLRSWVVWMDGYCRREGVREGLLRVVSKWQYRVMTHAWISWREQCGMAQDATRHVHRLKVAARVVWVRWAQRSLSAGLNTWRTSAHQQQQHAHFATAIRTRRHKFAKTCAVVNWYAHTADQKRFKRNTLAVGTFFNCRQLATEWGAWKWVLLRRQRQKVGARRGAMKRVYWLLTKVCNRWREQTICRVVDRFQNRIRAAGKTVRTLRRHSFTCVT